MLILNPDKIGETRFKGFGYRKDAANLWRVIDTVGGFSIGPHYQTKGELLADLPNFAEQYGLVKH